MSRKVGILDYTYRAEISWTNSRERQYFHCLAQAVEYCMERQWGRDFGGVRIVDEKTGAVAYTYVRWSTPKNDRQMASQPQEKPPAPPRRRPERDHYTTTAIRVRKRRLTPRIGD